MISSKRCEKGGGLGLGTELEREGATVGGRKGRFRSKRRKRGRERSRWHRTLVGDVRGRRQTKRSNILECKTLPTQLGSNQIRYEF